MSKSRGNSTSKAARSERQAKEIELLNSGKSQAQIAIELGISRPTLWRDLGQLTKNYTAGNQGAFGQLREMQVGALLDMAREVHDGVITSDVGNSVRGFLDSVTKLLGLNAENRSVVAHVTSNVDPKTLPLYRRFIHETRWVPEEKFERIWALCRELEELPGTRPTPGPPADSVLWHDAEENLLSDGGTDESA